MKKILLVFGALFLIVAFAVFAQSYLRQNVSFFQRSTTVTLGEQTLTLDIADTPEEREKGLSGRNPMPDNRGMLFVFDKPDMHSFWMKDMEIPLDIIFLNGNKVVTIHQNVQPPSEENQDLQLYSSTEPADRVLEVNAGTAAKYNIQQGSTLEINSPQ